MHIGGAEGASRILTEIEGDGGALADFQRRLIAAQGDCGGKGVNFDDRRGGIGIASQVAEARGVNLNAGHRHHTGFGVHCGRIEDRAPLRLDLRVLLEVAQKATADAYRLWPEACRFFRQGEYNFGGLTGIERGDGAASHACDRDVHRRR